MRRSSVELRRSLITRGTQGYLSGSPSLLATRGDSGDKVAAGPSPAAHAALATHLPTPAYKEERQYLTYEHLFDMVWVPPLPPCVLFSEAARDAGNAT